MCRVRGTVIIFYFSLSYSCLFLFCLLVLPYYMVNKHEYIMVVFHKPIFLQKCFISSVEHHGPQEHKRKDWVSVGDGHALSAAVCSTARDQQRKRDIFLSLPRRYEMQGWKWKKLFLYGTLSFSLPAVLSFSSFLSPLFIFPPSFPSLLFEPLSCPGLLHRCSC